LVRRLAVIVARGSATWLSCTDAAVSRHDTGISPSAVSMCSL
jgi:hypothetical protein